MVVGSSLIVSLFDLNHVAVFVRFAPASVGNILYGILFVLISFEMI